jgi:hypothetical protein
MHMLFTIAAATAAAATTVAADYWLLQRLDHAPPQAQIPRRQVLHSLEEAAQRCLRREWQQVDSIVST